MVFSLNQAFRRGFEMQLVERIAIWLGLVIAIIGGVGVTIPASAIILAVLGVVVGILSVGKDDTTGFLVFAIGLTAVSGGIDAIPVLGGHVHSILGNVSALVNAAAVVVVIRCVVSMTCLSGGGDDEDSAYPPYITYFRQIIVEFLTGSIRGEAPALIVSKATPITLRPGNNPMYSSLV
jgi:hypothetical protein